jgi:hypothetical protein
MKELRIYLTGRLQKSVSGNGEFVSLGKIDPCSSMVRVELIVEPFPLIPMCY